MPLKASHMGSETTGRKTPQRARLSDITNTAPLSFSRHREDDHVVNGCDNQLHKHDPLIQQLANLKKALAEKEELIQAQKVNMEKLWTSYNRKTKQNEDIIQQNGRLYKELMQARDRLKILQHENEQMTSAHKAVTSELQGKLAKALERVDLSQKVAGPPASEEKVPSDKQSTMPNLLAKLAESRARRTVISCEESNETLDLVRDESSSEHLATCRSTLRRRSSLSYKEPSLKTKLRQAESSTMQVKPCFHQRERGIHPLHKVCEEEPNIAPAAMPCGTEDKVAETLLPPCRTVPQTQLSVVSGDVLEDDSPLSKTVPEADTSSGEQLPRCTLESQVELPSGRPSRRLSVGTTSYKEAALNTKLRRSS